MNSIEKVYSTLIKQITGVNDYDKSFAESFVPLVSGYKEQSYELAERDLFLKSMIKSFPCEKALKSARDLEIKIGQTQSIELKAEYRKSQKKYSDYLSTHREISEQRDLIKIKLETALLSMQQISYDLLKMQGVDYDSYSADIIRSLDEKSKELETYVKILKQNFDNKNMVL